jgi:hypothetical protein
MEGPGLQPIIEYYGLCRERLGERTFMLPYYSNFRKYMKKIFLKWPKMTRNALKSPKNYPQNVIMTLNLKMTKNYL